MKNCLNCKYSRDVGPYLACYGHKGAPEVDYDYVCEDWKSQYAITNADRVRTLSNEDLADVILDIISFCNNCPVLAEGCPALDATKNVGCKEAMLGWLEQEVDDGD